MFTSAHANRSPLTSTSVRRRSHDATEQPANGLISEIVYREDQPMMTQLLLLPLLQQLGQQSRWQLWLTPQQKLSREWVQSSGLPLSKVMQISQLSPANTLESMVRSLRTGNYSVVIGWLSEELTVEDMNDWLPLQKKVTRWLYHASGKKYRSAWQTTFRA